MSADVALLRILNYTSRTWNRNRMMRDSKSLVSVLKADTCPSEHVCPAVSCSGLNTQHVPGAATPVRPGSWQMRPSCHTKATFWKHCEEKAQLALCIPDDDRTFQWKWLESKTCRTRAFGTFCRVLLLRPREWNQIWEAVSAGQDHRGRQPSSPLTWPALEKDGFQ